MIKTIFLKFYWLPNYPQVIKIYIFKNLEYMLHYYVVHVEPKYQLVLLLFSFRNDFFVKYIFLQKSDKNGQMGNNQGPITWPRTVDIEKKNCQKNRNNILEKVLKFQLGW